MLLHFMVPILICKLILLSIVWVKFSLGTSAVIFNDEMIVETVLMKEHAFKFRKFKKPHQSP